jgi:hypothetical protein
LVLAYGMPSHKIVEEFKKITERRNTKRPDASAISLWR